MFVSLQLFADKLSSVQHSLLSELDVRAGLMQSFSKEVGIYLCEEENTDMLRSLILGQLKAQDRVYYSSHKEAIETYMVDSYILPGRTKDSVGCPVGFEIKGKPCHWICAKDTQAKEH